MTDTKIRTLTDGANTVRVLMACPQPMFLVKDIVELARISSLENAIKFACDTDPKAFFCRAYVQKEIGSWGTKVSSKYVGKISSVRI